MFLCVCWILQLAANTLGNNFNFSITVCQMLCFQLALLPPSGQKDKLKHHLLIRFDACRQNSGQPEFGLWLQPHSCERWHFFLETVFLFIKTLLSHCVTWELEGYLMYLSKLSYSHILILRQLTNIMWGDILSCVHFWTFYEENEYVLSTKSNSDLVLLCSISEPIITSDAHKRTNQVPLLRRIAAVLSDSE